MYYQETACVLIVVSTFHNIYCFIMNRLQHYKNNLWREETKYKIQPHRLNTSDLTFEQYNKL